MLFFVIMNCFPIRKDNNSDILSPGKQNKLRKRYKDYLLPNITPSEQRILIQRSGVIKNLQKPKPDLQDFKKIIEETLRKAKNNRNDLKNISKKYLSEDIKEIKNKGKIEDDGKPKASVIGRFIRILPRNIKTKSPGLYKKSTKPNIFFIRNQCPKIMDHYSFEYKERKHESDEDKMDTNLDLYYL